MAISLSPIEDSVRLAAPRAVLCGSFRRDPGGLREAYSSLERAGCAILSPSSLEFVDEREGFVVTAAELHEEPATIEARHLGALRSADFVWLHAPRGYIGPSAALELGVASTLDVPVYATSAPTEVALAQFVTVIGSPQDAVDQAQRGLRTPAGPLRDLQRYYERMADQRGFTRESPQDTMLLLTEEVGELARAIRRHVALARADDGSGPHDPGSELADVQLYVLHLANVMGIDLAAAVAAKERVNHARYAPAA